MTHYYQGRKPRIAWMEEWMSSLGSQVLPELARKYEIYYVTAGDAVPGANFARVIRGKSRRYMNVAGIELSRCVNRLYRERLIDIAVVWASIGFGLQGIPFVNLEGGSVYAQIVLFGSQRPLHKRLRFLPGLVHYALPEMLCNRRAARVIVPSNALKRDLMKLHGLAESKVSVVPHGVERQHLTLYERKLMDRCPKVLFIGRLHFGKGIVPVLKEFVRRRDIVAEFVIVGDGPDRKEMEEAASGDDRVRIIGQVNRMELESILLTTNIFVFPTFYEGFGLALIEAMASGHACVTYDIPVTREVLGDCGVYVPAEDAVALVDEVAQLVEAPVRIRDWSARAHDRAGEFSWEDAAMSIDRILRDTVFEYGTGRL